MKKTYKFTYEEGKFVFRYTRPDNKEEPLVIDESKMELNTQKFYELFFQNNDDEIEIVFENSLDQTGIDIQVIKRGNRIFDTVKDLYNDIHEEIVKKLREK